MQPSELDKQIQPDPMRRRLARGALAGSAVLGSLISKPVLGAVPYNCTLSGKMSGNTSSHGAPVLCSALGRSPATWATTATWPLPYTHGTVPDNTCVFSGAGAGSRFGATFANVFSYSASGGTCNVTNTVSNNTVATMLQVLSTTDTSPIFELGRAAVASLLNAQSAAAGTYPLNPAQVIAMFNAVYTGGSSLYVYSPTIKLNQAQVLAYLKSLYV